MRIAGLSSNLVEDRYYAFTVEASRLVASKRYNLYLGSSNGNVGIEPDAAPPEEDPVTAVGGTCTVLSSEKKRAVGEHVAQLGS